MRQLADTAIPGLPHDVQKHLGRTLSALYDGLAARSDGLPDRLDGLLKRLERALGGVADADEKVFRAELLEMVLRLHKFAMSLAKNPAAADDLVQDTLLRGWRSRARFAPGTNFGAWLFTIMRNVFYSTHRKHSREVPDRDGDQAERLATVPEQTGHLDLQDARAALDELPAAMREALLLVAVENLSYEEAANVMRCRVGTVKSRVWRARAQLAKLLGYDSGEVGADSTTLSAMNGTRLVGEPA